MHSLLKSVGFLAIQTKEDEDKLLNKIIDYSKNNYETMGIQPEASHFAEISMEFADGLGITICGEYDANHNFHLDHYFPFLKGREVSITEEIYISKRSESESYGVICDDYRFGAALVYYLQNSIEYINRGDKSLDGIRFPMYLSALAMEGTILLPTVSSKVAVLDPAKKGSQREEIFKSARRGDQEAIEKITIQEIDNYSEVNERIKHEDVFSIVETSFVPYGVETETYRMVGIILDCEKRVNFVTGEEIFLMKIFCNDVIMDLCVNRANLIGEPQVGRRFRGAVWLQGRVDFEGK